MGSAPFPRPDPDVLSRRVGDEVVLVHLRTNRIYSLNPTAGRLWELLAAGMGVKEAFACMKEEFDVSDEMLGQETASLIELLEGEGLVERSDEH